MKYWLGKFRRERLDAFPEAALPVAQAEPQASKVEEGPDEVVPAVESAQEEQPAKKSKQDKKAKGSKKKKKGKGRRKVQRKRRERKKRNPRRKARAEQEFALNANFQFQLPDGHNREQIEALLVGNFPFKVEEPVSEKWVFYDTFDWLLFNQSLSLHQAGQELYLRALPDGEIISSLFTTAVPRFSWDFPESALKNHLGPIIEPRALLVLSELQMQSCTYRILNKDRKTVAHLSYTEAGAAQDSSPTTIASYLSLRAVRGYPKYAQQITTHLEQAGYSFSNWGEFYFRTLEAAGKEPGSYSSKMDVQLEPGMRSDEAAKIILRRLLEIIKANEAGIQADIDTEFLHDYRVAIRRTRSALSQIKDVFPTRTNARFKGEFANLGKFTNELRDLDVYLLSEDKYCDMLPDVLRDDISPLFEYLRAQREISVEGSERSYQL